MKRPRTQRQIASRELLAHVSRFVGIAIAHRHVSVKDGESCHGSLLGAFHGGFAHSRPRPVRSDDDRPGNQCSVGEGRDHAIAALVECDVDERFTVLRASVPESAPNSAQQSTMATWAKSCLLFRAVLSRPAHLRVDALGA